VPEGEFDFWATRSGGCIQRGPAKLVSATRTTSLDRQRAEILR
jgi:hypothetical protein